MFAFEIAAGMAAVAYHGVSPRPAARWFARTAGAIMPVAGAGQDGWDGVSEDAPGTRPQRNH